MNKAPARPLQESSHATHRFPRQTAAFWFSTQFGPGALLIGFFGPLHGLTFWQSLVAMIPAVLLGSLLPALSRTRLWAAPAALLLFVLNLQILLRAATHLLPGSPLNWQLLALMLAAVMAVIGPPLLYRLQTLLAPILALVFGLLTLGTLLMLDVDTAPRQLNFSWWSFGLLALLAALWPAGSPHLGSVCRPSYPGIALPALWLMPLGALMASAIPAVDSVVSVRLVGEHFYPGLGMTAVLLGMLSMTSAMAVHGHAVVQRLNEKARVPVLAGLALLALWITGQLPLINLLR